MEDMTTQCGSAPLPLEKDGRRQNWVWWGLLLLALLLPVLLLVRMPETPLDQAKSLVRSNKIAAALPLLENIARAEPDNHDVLPWLALCYLSTDRIAEGRTALDTAIKVKLHPESLVPALESYINYYEQRNDFAEAERLFTVLEKFKPSGKLESARKQLYLSWSKFDASETRLEDAISHLQAAIKVDEADPLRPEWQHKLAEYYRRLAASQEDSARAINILEQSLTASDEPGTRIALSELYAAQGQGTQAVAHLKRVSQMDPNNLEARHRTVDLCLKLNDFKGAQEALSELADREKCVENYSLLADLHLRLQNYPGAVRALEEASNLSRNDAPVLAKLKEALLTWSLRLAQDGKLEESASVKGRAERINDMLKDLGVPQELPAEAQTDQAGTDTKLSPGGPPISLCSARIWLSRGSYTPEGEIGVKNVSGTPLTDLSMTMVFYDNTARRRINSVTASAASPQHPMLPDQTRTVYFSSPTTVKAEHKLCVLLFWKGRLIRELPVVKEH